MSIRSREGTLPFVELNGIEYCDSSLAVRDLTQIMQKESIESVLNLEQRAVARALENLTECSLLPTSAYFRLPFTKDMLKLYSQKSIPTIFLPFVALMIVKYVSYFNSCLKFTFKKNFS